MEICLRRKANLISFIESFANSKQIESFVKRRDLVTWEEIVFYSPIIERPSKKRSSGDSVTFTAVLFAEIRKPSLNDSQEIEN